MPCFCVMFITSHVPLGDLLTSRSICDGIQYKHERALTIMTSLQQDITSCEERTINTTEAHEVHLKERGAVMQKIKVSGHLCMTYLQNFSIIIFIIIFYTQVCDVGNDV